MASLSVSSTTTTKPHSPAHHRKHSRNPSAAPLPSFNFNPSMAASIPSPEPSPVLTSLQSDEYQGHARQPSKPAPLPEFKFNPGADVEKPPTPSPTHPVLEEMAMNQQRVSRSAKPAPLPMFTFNPSSAPPPPRSVSPNKSDFSGLDTPKMSLGHRRSDSEFVGGIGTTADAAQMVATSPPKQDSVPTHPPISGVGRRGHMHRRSQAISVSDIDTSELIKAHAKSRNTSTPTTPHAPNFGTAPSSPSKRTSMASVSRSPPGSPRRNMSASLSRPRTVDFSDKVDVIPRPLSLISSGTEGSNSTVRGHSHHNSINSIASLYPNSSSFSMSMPASTTPSIQEEQKRPNTADACLLLTTASKLTEENTLSLPKRPLSAYGSPVSPAHIDQPAKKKHFWSSYSKESSPAVTPKIENEDPFISSPTLEHNVATETKRPKTSPVQSSSKRHKYHTWTAGTFLKKVRRGGVKVKPRRTPTPPALMRRDSDKVNEIFDFDDTVVLRDDPPPSEGTLSPMSTQFPKQSPAFEDVPSPMLDLDAALGPFGSEERFSSSTSRAPSARIAKLHSSERRGVVDAFGTFHRRTESAPNMPAMNRPLFTMSRHTSNGSLAEEVFDEEEEDNFLADQEKASMDVPRVGTDTEITPRPPRRTYESMTDGLGLGQVNSADDAVIIIDTENEAEADDLRSSQSTIEAPPHADHDILKRPSTSPMPFAYPQTQSLYASSTDGRATTASLISSPDPEHISFDGSSRPSRFGEQSPDFRFRPSTEDIPSLSDSVSSAAIPRVSSSGGARPRPDQRSNSMFVPGSSRSNNDWKRSSLASLNRLIPGSSHGSKLKFETMSSPPTEEKTKRKSNRMSKLIKFWRKDEQKA